MLRKKVDVMSFKEEVESLRRSRLMVILMVYFALVLDNMLLTVVVPIIPDYLYQMENQQTEKFFAENLDNSLPTRNENMIYSDINISHNLLYPAKKDIFLNAHNRPKSKSLSEIPVHDSKPQDRYRSSLTNSDSDNSEINNKNIGHLSSVEFSPDTYLSERAPDANRTSISSGVLEKIKNPGESRYSTTYSESLTGDMIYQKQNNKPTTIKYDTINVNKANSEDEEHVENANINPKHPSGPSTEKSHQKSAHTNDDTQTVNSSLLDSSELKPPAVTSSDLSEQYPSNSSKITTTRGLPLPIIIPIGKNPITSPRLKNSSTVPYPQNPLQKNSINLIQSTMENNLTNLSYTNALHSEKLPQDIINENGRVGLLFSSKAFVQLIVNPFIGPLTSRIGYTLPLVVGTHNLIISALLYAYAESYTLLFIARSIQGIASSCIAISGMGIIAECYPDDQERGRMQGIVMGGIALGVLAGYPMGSLLYDFTNSKASPFLLVAVLTAVLALIQLAVLNPRPTPERLVVATPISGLIRDPYILVTAGAVMVSTSAMAVLEPCLPIWLTDTLHPQKWQLGTAFIPDSVGYLVGTSCTAGSAYKIGRWRAAVIAMMMVAFAAAAVPEAGSMMALAGPHLFLGMGVGTIDAALMPLLAAIVDARHVAAYGAVYAIAQAAVALAYGLGPLIGGAVVRQIGFPWLMRGVAILNLCYCPLLFSLGTFSTDSTEAQAILMAAPDPTEYTRHTTNSVQPHEASLRYQQLFDEED